LIFILPYLLDGESHVANAAGILKKIGRGTFNFRIIMVERQLPNHGTAVSLNRPLGTRMMGLSRHLVRHS
jgi:hypothetical protein